MHIGRFSTFAQFFLTAAGLPTTQEPLPNHASNRTTISPAFFAELEELARLVDISYCVGTTGTGIRKPFNCLSRCKDFTDLELVSTWNTGPLLSDSCGYIALAHPPANTPRLLVLFRGTYSLASTIADLSTLPQPYTPYPTAPDGPRCDGCTVHAGFAASWRHARAVVLPHLAAAAARYPGYALALAGHSLGGAVAALAALELLAAYPALSVTTFGAPRLGNEALAEYVAARFGLEDRSGLRQVPRYRRVTHAEDPVPLLPPDEWAYAPTAGELFIAKRALPPQPGDVRVCDGPTDPACIAGSDGYASISDDDAELCSEGAVRKEGGEMEMSEWSSFPWHRPWKVPARFKLWQLFFAHRDYFWRLGLCVPGVGQWDVGDRQGVREGTMEL